MTPKTLIDTVKILDYGHVALENVLGSDLSIINSARVSFDQQSDELGDAEHGLINFLMRNKHGTPFEAVVFSFDVKLPIFVMREWIRHRIGSFNEMSGRYTELPSEYYIPAQDHIRTQVGKPGNYTFEPITDHQDTVWVQHVMETSQRLAFDTYHAMLNRGIAKEVARMVLPVGTYTRMKWVVNLRSLLNFLSLRNHEQAQREIRDFAVAVEAAAKLHVPITFEAFEKNGRIAP